jgi:hypothetical protein
LMHALARHAQHLPHLGDSYEVELLRGRHFATVPLTYDNIVVP